MRALWKVSGVAVVLVLAQSVMLAAASAKPVRPGNILLIVADDIGVEMLASYNEGGGCSVTPQHCSTDTDCPVGETCEADYPPTPYIDKLAGQGILFRNAWSTPVCSPTRATILTGRYGFRNTVLRVNNFLPYCELTIPEVLDSQVFPQYTHAAFGKWHLAGLLSNHPDQASFLSNPNDQGFSHFAGAIRNLGPSNIRACSVSGGLCVADEECPAGETCTAGLCDANRDIVCDTSANCPPGDFCRTSFPADFFHWAQTVNGVKRLVQPDPDADPPVTLADAYATTVHVDETLAWIKTKAREPWFAYVAFNAAHAPWGVPPHELVSQATIDELNAAGLSPGDRCGASRLCYEAQIEAMDTEIGRLLEKIPDRTTVVFVGDNGTPRPVTAPPFDPSHAKGSLYEGGINVPLIITSPTLTLSRGLESEVLVDTVDLYGLVLGLAGAKLPIDRVIDADKGLSLLSPVFFGPSPFAYSENWSGQTVRDDRFKLIRKQLSEEFYDLLSDPFETNNLLPDLDPALAPRLESLQQRMDDLRATADPCE